MSRAMIAEAVLRNVLYFFGETKECRKGIDIASRDFLLAVCFHKEGFTGDTFSLRRIAQLTGINRKTVTHYAKNQVPLKKVRFQVFKKIKASNYWPNKQVCRIFFSIFMLCWHVRPYTDIF